MNKEEQEEIFGEEGVQDDLGKNELLIQTYNDSEITMQNLMQAYKTQYSKRKETKEESRLTK